MFGSVGRRRTSSVHRLMHKGPRRGRAGPPPSDPPSPSSSSGDGSASCFGLEVDKSIDRGRRERDGKMCCYRSQLEREVQKLQKQLQEEIDLHVALANAVANNAAPSLYSPMKLPNKAQELLANIATLEITVAKLEEELVSLQSLLFRERNERILTETHLGCLPSLSPESPSSDSAYMWEEHISSLRISKFTAHQIPHSPGQDLLSGYGDLQLVTVNRPLDRYPGEQILGSCSRGEKRKKINLPFEQFDAMDLKKNSPKKNLWQHPNKLSEEMVRCMRNIFLRLSESSNSPSKVSPSQRLPSTSSPVGHLSRSSLTSFSDSSIMPSMLWSPSHELHPGENLTDEAESLDSYRVNGKVNWRDIGDYSLASEVSWMFVGKTQLEYATEALKNFRLLVEQLEKVDPARMRCSEKLAFWINLYNALIMHAYLAYGVPRSDIKLFSLMQKACYTVGGQSFSAADIEFVILKMKPPAHRPQLALMLALHKFKTSDEHTKYSVDGPEPLAVFALSNGMYSSPAVRIFTAENVHDELHDSMKDYIRASIGISDKGKLLVPKLLHCYAKSVVEDSLLVDWICRYLSPDQVSIVRDSMKQRKQRLLGVRSFSIVPFDSRFRYLFLPDSNRSSQSPSRQGSV